MILSGNEIRNRVDIGEILINPFVPENLNPNSYNYRLGEEYALLPKEYSLGEGGINGVSSRIPEDGLLVRPGTVLLANTYEVIGSKHFVTSLMGRSSIGRLGLFVQISADLGNLGPAHKWTLEITSVQPVIIYPKMTIGQVSFWVPYGDINAYSGNYVNFDSPQFCIDTNLISGIREDDIDWNRDRKRSA
jgi:dCTP deaminase